MGALLKTPSILNRVGKSTWTAEYLWYCNPKQVNIGYAQTVYIIQ